MFSDGFVVLLVTYGLLWFYIILCYLVAGLSLFCCFWLLLFECFVACYSCVCCLLLVYLLALMNLYRVAGYCLVLIVLLLDLWVFCGWRVVLGVVGFALRWILTLIVGVWLCICLPLIASLDLLSWVLMLCWMLVCVFCIGWLYFVDFAFWWFSCILTCCYMVVIALILMVYTLTCLLF